VHEVSYSTGAIERVYRLVIPRAVLDAIVRIARERSPREACGVLMGRVSEGVARIEAIEELENVLGAEDAFWFDVREWMEKIIKWRKRGMEYIGLFHSHVRGSAYPSLSDRERMLECPGEVWLIVALQGGEPEFTAWRIDDFGSSIMKLSLEVIEGV